MTNPKALLMTNPTSLLALLTLAALPLLSEDDQAVFACGPAAGLCENCSGRRSREAHYCTRCGHRRVKP